MSTLSQFAGGARVPKVLVNHCSSGGVKATGALPNTSGGTKTVATGALSAGVLATVLSITGQGAVSFLGCCGADATSRTHRMKVTIDGVVVFDATSSSCTANYEGSVVIGSFAATGVSSASAYAPDPVPFNQSFLVEYASSVTETAKTNIGYVYRTY